MSTEKQNEKKLKKERWKAYKQNKKQERKDAKLRLKEEYADAPALTKFVHVHAAGLKRLCAAVVIICLVVYTAIANDFHIFLINQAVDTAVDVIASMDMPPEEIYEHSPLDEEGGKRIDAIPGNDADDTWTFCVYMVGADLEDAHEDDRSAYVYSLTAGIAQENRYKARDDYFAHLNRYTSELEAKGLDLPAYMYAIEKPVASSTPVTDDVIVASRTGCASADIQEMCSVPMPDNVTIVLQPGGATRWSNSLINPNRTQRFVIKNGIMDEVENMRIQDSCDPDTLADFISYCDENYKSDHMALILWDHGGGVTGYGHDSIFGSGLSLQDLTAACEKSLKKNEADPYFDFVGFDACLMATVETATAFNGYGKYLVASEEQEPGDGWDYITWLQKLAKDPTLSAARIGRDIADSYMDYYVIQNRQISWIAGDIAVTFSVTDIPKAAQLYDAYESMNEEFLKLIAEDSSVLGEMSRAASKTIRYSGSNYDYFNMIDLGVYVDYLSEKYPEETKEVRELLKEAVLYKRSNVYLDDSQGLSVYFPATISGLDSMILLTDYVYNISDKPCTNALYYYKAAGCLNDEMDEAVSAATGKHMKTMNTQLFYDYQKIEPKINEENEIVIDITEDLKDNIQDVYLEIAKYDEEQDTITYYGTDDDYEYSTEGDIVGKTDGLWFALDGSFLQAEYAFETDTTSTYIAKVLHNGVPTNMTFSFNDETGEININEMHPIPEKHPLSYDAASRVMTQILPGDTIIPILTEQTADGMDTHEIKGEKVKYNENSKIELVNLPEGTYLEAVVIRDLRGDTYYSPVIEAQMAGGKVTGLSLNPYFVGQ